jgi:hypothetical protein
MGNFISGRNVSPGWMLSFYGLFNDIQNLDYVVWNGEMIDKLERIWKEGFMAYLRYYSRICMEWPRKIWTEHLLRASLEH